MKSLLPKILVAALLLFVFSASTTYASWDNDLSFSNNLSYGSLGAAVVALQQFLTSQGVYSGPITGNFYRKTLKAVQSYQQKEGITPASGYFGPITRSHANSASTTPPVATTTTPVVTQATSTQQDHYRDGHSRSQNQAQNQGTTTVATSTPATSTPPVVVTTSTTGLQWGAYVGDITSDAASFESLVGQKMDMQAIFVGWGSDQAPFPSNYGPTVRDQGETLVVFWEPDDGSGSLNQPSYNYDSITNGSWDSYLSSFSADAKSYSGQVILVPFAEMNGNWDPWDGTVNGNSPAKFIAAWQHVRSFFTNDSNVKFAWDVNSDSVPDTSGNSIASYYPGSAYVDYVGVDVFNFGNPWQSFSTIASQTLSQLSTYQKPIYLFSLASAQGSQKASWITDALTVQIPSNPLIKGWIWFNQNKEENWTVNSDAASLAAFKQAIPSQ